MSSESNVTTYLLKSHIVWIWLNSRLNAVFVNWFLRAFIYCFDSSSLFFASSRNQLAIVVSTIFFNIFRRAIDLYDFVSLYLFFSDFLSTTVFATLNFLKWYDQFQQLCVSSVIALINDSLITLRKWFEISFLFDVNFLLRLLITLCIVSTVITECSRNSMR